MIPQWLIRVGVCVRQKAKKLCVMPQHGKRRQELSLSWPTWQQQQLPRAERDNECFHILPWKLTKWPLYQLRACFSREWPLSNLTFQLFFSFSSWFCHPSVPRSALAASEDGQGMGNGFPSWDPESQSFLLLLSVFILCSIWHDFTWMFWLWTNLSLLDFYSFADFWQKTVH